MLACSFSAALDIIEDSPLNLEFLGLDYWNRHQRYTEIPYLKKKKNLTKLQIEETTIKDDINKPKRNMDGQVKWDGED